MRSGAGRIPLIIAGIAALVTYAAFGEQAPFGFLQKIHLSCHLHHDTTAADDATTDDEDSIVVSSSPEKRSVTPFDSIALEGATDADMTSCDTQSLAITAASGSKHLETTVPGGKLVVGGQRGGLRLQVTAPQHAMPVEGAGKVTLAGLRDPTSIRANGPIHLSATGAGASAELTRNGPSKLSLTKLEAKNMVIQMNGVGDAEVNATENLIAEVRGSGHVRYLCHAHTVAEIHVPRSVERLPTSDGG
ncbi:MAG: hypothetical protein JWM91_4037 [Rhodospirillales bacterium]|nr:hypothetical protein [Rhodospirillales bacterium]